MKKELVFRVVGAGCLVGVLSSPFTSFAGWQIADTGVTRVAVAGSFVFASTTNGVLRSGDNGNTWQNVVGMKTFSNLAGNGTTIYATGDSGLVASTDHGTSWNVVGTPSREYNVYFGLYFALSVQDNRILLVSSRYFLSVDNGQTWKILNTNYDLFSGSGSIYGPWSACIVGNILLLGGSAGISRSVTMD